jgi:hypothetical protein
MERRQFLSASLAASAAALAGTAAVAQKAEPAKTSDFLLLRRYLMTAGAQLKATEEFFSKALIPALGRMGLGPVGAFKVDVGQDINTYYLLIPAATAQVLAELDLTLANDAAFMAAADSFWNARANAAPFQRIESSLLKAFPGWPKVTPPAGAAIGAKRMFQLRIYESASHGEHARKVEMFHKGEFELFQNAGFHPVFFGDALIGTRIPNLHYMLAFDSMADLEAKWNVFRNDPGWKKLSSDPRYGYDTIVNNISNLYLVPLECSQI